MGDMNRHNPLWGSKRFDRRGKIIEKLTDDINISLLNDGIYTDMCNRTGNLSARDLT